MGATLYHRHGDGIDLVPGNHCIAPEQDDNIILAFTPDDLASYVEGFMARALREAADRVTKFRDWYPTSVFPTLEEALSDNYTPSSEQIAASSYRHAYGELVPRNLRTWAAEIEAGEWVLSSTEEN